MFLLDVERAVLSQFYLKLLGAYGRLLRAVRLKWSTSSLVEGRACQGPRAVPAGTGWYGCVSLNPHSVVWGGWGWRWLANYLVKVGQLCSLAFYGADVPVITSPTAQRCWCDDYGANKRSAEAFHLYLLHFIFVFYPPFYYIRSVSSSLQLQNF